MPATTIGPRWTSRLRRAGPVHARRRRGPDGEPRRRARPPPATAPKLVSLPRRGTTSACFDAALAWRMVPLDADLRDSASTSRPTSSASTRKVVWLAHQHRSAYDGAGGRGATSGSTTTALELQRLLTEWDTRALVRSPPTVHHLGCRRGRLAGYNGLASEPLAHPAPLWDRLHPGPPAPPSSCPLRLEGNKRPELLVEALAHVKSGGTRGRSPGAARWPTTSRARRPNSAWPTASTCRVSFADDALGGPFRGRAGGRRTPRSTRTTATSRSRPSAPASRSSPPPIPGRARVGRRRRQRHRHRRLAGRDRRQRSTPSRRTPTSRRRWAPRAVNSSRTSTGAPWWPS